MQIKRVKSQTCSRARARQAERFGSLALWPVCEYVRVRVRGEKSNYFCRRSCVRKKPQVQVANTQRAQSMRWGFCFVAFHVYVCVCVCVLIGVYCVMF